jgi:uncharacterized membrane protein
MEKMLVVVFDSESKAYEGTDVLRQLDRDGSISVHAGAVIRKDADGKAVVLTAVDDFPVSTMGGTAIGSLIGLLGGPVGVVVGATMGTLLGSVDDLYRAGVSAEFVDDVSAILMPGRYAVVADISEEWITPLDARMEKIGGMVFRTARIDVETEQMRNDIAALDLEIAQLKAEMKEAGDERKASLQAKVDKLNEDRRKRIEKANQRLEQINKEHDSKVQALKEKAAQAHGKTKAAIDARLTEINQHFQSKVAQWKNLRAEKLERKADLLEEEARKMRSQANALKQPRKA